jgi:hypothetical protein
VPEKLFLSLCRQVCQYGQNLNRNRFAITVKVLATVEIVLINDGSSAQPFWTEYKVERLAYGGLAYVVAPDQ